MPEMDGYDLAREIRRAENGGRHVPIVAFTANAIKGEAEHCFAAGMDDCLTKPVQLPALKAVLQKWMQGSEPK
jgi:CheY-like chemotaxis protein